MEPGTVSTTEPAVTCWKCGAQIDLVLDRSDRPVCRQRVRCAKALIDQGRYTSEMWGTFAQ